MNRASGTSSAERWGLIALLFGTAIACSSSSGSSSATNPTDASTGGSAGSNSSGGASGGGAPGEGGSIGSGGSTGGAGGAGGAGTGGVPDVCATPTADWLPPMKTCTSDADCKVVPTYTCCGPSIIYGIATTSVPQFSQCFKTSPPTGCPPLGCASQAQTEDHQPYPQLSFGTGDLSGVEARCVDIGGGAKACTSTLKGACNHDVTRCAAGDVCSNPCGASCTCQNGYVNCRRPTGTCTTTTAFCEYAATPDSQAFTTCTCPSPGAPWSCSP